MKEFAKKLVARSYKKRIVSALIAAALLLVAAAVLIPVTLHRQIAEFRALEEAREEQKNTDSAGAFPNEQAPKKHDGKEEKIKSVLRQLTPIGTGTKIAFAVIAALACLIGVFYWITVAEWLFKIAVLHGLNRALWPMLGLLFNLLVFPVLLVVLCDPRREGKQVQQ